MARSKAHGRSARFAFVFAALPLVGACATGKRLDLLQEQVDLLRAEVATQHTLLDRAKDERESALEAIDRIEAALVELDREGLIDRRRLDDLTALVVRERDEQRRFRTSTSEWRAWIDGRVVGLERSAGVPRATAPWEENGDAVAVFIEADIQEARGHLAEGRPAHAREVALRSLREHGDHADAAELRVLVAETWFEEERWSRAAEAYNLVIEAHPETRWAAPARLRLARCFEAIGDLSTARVVLEDVVRYHPSTEEAARASERLEALADGAPR